MNQDSALDGLRAQIDEIDDALHDLLMRRADVVREVAHIKGTGPVIRPGREATMLRRLIGRHRGALPARALVRIWRELLAATSSMQGAFAYAVMAGAHGEDLTELGRDQYGARTKATRMQTINQVMRAINGGEATVAIVPLPTSDDQQPWWPTLLSSDAPSIVGRLPFVVAKGEPVPAEALVLARLDPEETESDNSYIAFESGAQVSRGTLLSGLERANLKPISLTSTQRPGDDHTVYLIEVPDFIAAGSPKLAALEAQDSLKIQWTRVLGAYATPLKNI